MATPSEETVLRRARGSRTPSLKSGFAGGERLPKCAASLLSSTSFAIAILVAGSAAAHDPVKQHTGWFVKQYNKLGIMCCTGYDAYYLEPDEWKRSTSRITASS